MILDLCLCEEDEAVALPGALSSVDACYNGKGSIKNELVVMEGDEDDSRDPG